MADTAPVEVLVIGAGAAGAVLTRRLAEAGFDVLCLEQGRWHDRAEYRGAERDWELTARGPWSPDPNVRALPQDYPVDAADAEITPLMFNGVGGGTVLYAGIWPRLLPSDFRVRTLDGVGADWPLSYSELLPYYERIDASVGVSGLGGNPAYPPGADPPLPPLPIGAAGMKVARAHNDLGWHWWPATNAIISAPYLERKNACVQRGTCMQGCGEGAKSSLDLTHWPHALQRGARLRTGITVRRLALGAGGLVRGVEYVDEDGHEGFQAADVVVLAANGVGTARLLLASADAHHPEGLANSSGLVGRNLMMHPFATVTGFFDDPLGSWQGHFGSAVESMEFYESDPDRGFVRGAKWGLAPTGGPLTAALPPRPEARRWGADHHEMVRERLGRSANWAIMGEDLPEADNRVTLSPTLADRHGNPAPRVHYRLSENSRRMLEFHTSRAAESLTAAGARRTHVTPHVRAAGWHLLGTARMGADPASSVVDGSQRAHDHPNLYVADGSVFVTAGGVNPTATICALALRTADLMIERRRDQQVAR